MPTAEVDPSLKPYIDQLSGLSDDQLYSYAQQFGLLKRKIVLDDLWIIDKNSNLIPYKPNGPQQKLYDAIVPNWRRDDYACTGKRVDILKYRQPGFSTAILAIMFCWTVNESNFKSWIVGADEDGAKLLWEKIECFWKNLDANLKPKAKYDARGELHFSETGSWFQMATAGKLRLGRGTTINALHCSEIAWWENAGKVLGGLLQAVPVTGNVFKETTAHGYNDYYNTWEREQKGESNFEPLFFAWNEFPDYQMPPAMNFKRSEEENELAQAFSLTDAQLQWRRMKRNELADTDTPFEQEYPLTWVEAFRESANAAYYNIPYLTKLMETLKAPEYDPIRTISPRTDEYIGGTLEIYEEPIPGVQYVAGADVAHGITDETDHDYSTLDIFRADTREQVASYYGRPDPIHFANDIQWVCGRDRFNAFTVIERNLDGYTVLEELRRIGFGNLYYHITPRRSEGRTVEDTEAGYPITTTTKAERDGKLKAAINREARGGWGIKLKSRRVVKELLHYVNLKNGRRGAEVGHDDHNSSVGLANLAFEDLPMPWHKPQELPRPRVMYGVSVSMEGGDW